ncbi:MAG TPA: hypothetical protein EYO34_05630 [Candidatus Marinimicrobia bacterium]|nr:hypothetical protein [Candidatus Neomarinimicrobiota bacterium]HIB04091.1 hypothetical protein [Candidatus Neomarinimicrobiota bacterium]HIB71001.1 hypothetical protein [Candidatus Neomarinimicrobiota bacterium]HIB95487.1 hypothetical protein [Candidatus Neomarinimicrobiota bacterium]HIO55570.1 hypothetical protein [Candidatus Neomarinimicrobiota bacterium]
MNDLLLELRSEGINDVYILGINGIDYEDKSLAGMINGRILPWAQDNADQRVWESWKVFIRDLFVLDRDGHVVEVVNLTSFNPDPSQNDGENYRAIKNLLLGARDQ